MKNRKIQNYIFEDYKNDFKEKKTPFLYMDMSKIENNYIEMKESLENTEIFYAIKANSNRKILRKLKILGSSFDIASKGELNILLEEGVDPDKISFGNTIKKEEDIKYAYENGIRLFVVDEFAEMEKVARVAKGSKVFIRLSVDNDNTDWPLTEKFGCNREKAVEILEKAKEKGLIPYGISFHVGSQCYNKFAWRNALEQVREIFDNLKNKGINLKFINLGGGIPVQHIKKIPTVKEISEIINETIKKEFKDYDDLKIASEPGRSLVGDAGTLITKVILKSQRKKTWLYLDTGIFHGLFETIQNFRYEIISESELLKLDDQDTKSYTLSGPTCDSIDTMYKDINLPADIEIGDYLFIKNAGAYTTAYATNFNGIKAPKIYFKGDDYGPSKKV
ncbi:MAG: type III PLP-dependent enzyme [Fusobacteriota bacterium]